MVVAPSPVNIAQNLKNIGDWSQGMTATVGWGMAFKPLSQD